MRVFALASAVLLAASAVTAQEPSEFDSYNVAAWKIIAERSFYVFTGVVQEEVWIRHPERHAQLNAATHREVLADGSYMVELVDPSLYHPGRAYRVEVLRYYKPMPGMLVDPDRIAVQFPPELHIAVPWGSNRHARPTSFTVGETYLIFVNPVYAGGRHLDPALPTDFSGTVLIARDSEGREVSRSWDPLAAYGFVVGSDAVRITPETQAYVDKILAAISIDPIWSSITSPASEKTASGWLTLDAEMRNRHLTRSVQYFVDGEPVTGALAVAGTLESRGARFPTTNLSDGRHTIFAIVEDVAGGKHRSQAVSFRVDNRHAGFRVEASPRRLWPADNRMIPVSVTFDGSTQLEGFRLRGVSGNRWVRPDQDIAGGRVRDRRPQLPPSGAAGGKVHGVLRGHRRVGKDPDGYGRDPGQGRRARIVNGRALRQPE